MESVTNKPPLVVILGQTASGKSALALLLAQQFNGEIIAADSRTVYRGMDIGTAKPTPQEMKVVPHHLINVVDPDQPFTVADFQRLANEAIEDIAARGKVPLLVGGTGLYIDAVIYNFSLRPSGGDTAQRQQLESLTVEELQTKLTERGIRLPQNPQNPRHLIRTLETEGGAARRESLRPHTLVIGLDIDKDELEQKIIKRTEAMVKEGLIEEVRQLTAHYGWDTPALQVPAYKAFRPYLAGMASLEEAKRAFVQNDLHYAKRQKTWFKRNQDIHWISKTEQAVELITTLVNK